MATRVLTINEAMRQANVDLFTPARDPAGGIMEFSIALISSEWDSKAGTGTVVFSLQRSDDAGLNWYHWIYGGFPDPTTGEPQLEPLPIGFRPKNGGMPGLAASSDFGFFRDDQANLVRLRLYAKCSVALRLGATVTVSN